MQLNLLLITVMIVLSGYAAHADEQINEEVPLGATELREKRQSLPRILATPLYRSITKEYYITQVMKYMRHNGVDGTKFTPEGLIEKQKMALSTYKKNQISQVLKYDNNFDTNVTKEEVKNTILNYESILTVNDRQKNRIKDAIKYVRDLDTDNDGIVSYLEMGVVDGTVKAEILDRATSKYQQHLDLDPNNDGILTGNELEGLARAAFDIFDANKDGVISREENKVYTEIVVQKQNAPKDTEHP